MTKKISASDVSKVAHLARLDIPEKELEAYTDQLEKILSYVEQLEEINTEGVSPTTRAVEVVNVQRNDEVNASKIKEDLLELAPEREGDFYRVPKILDS